MYVLLKVCKKSSTFCVTVIESVTPVCFILLHTAVFYWNKKYNMVGDLQSLWCDDIGITEFSP